MGDTSKGPVLRGPFGELRPLAAALTLGFGLSLAPTTYAATFTVTNLNDSGAGSLRDAVTQANAAVGPDTIDFTVTGTISLATQIVIGDDVTITGPGAASLTVSPTGTDRVFYINDANPTVTISGITIQRTSGGTTGKGGAIYNYAGNLTIQNSVISGNQSSDKGGAIYNYGGTVNIVNSTLSGNSAANKGGAIYNYGGTVNITNSTLSGNTAAAGGGIYNYNGTVSIVSSTLSGNQATSFSGGGLYARNGTVTIQNSTFSGNTAASYGGGVFSEYAPVTITNSTFSGNTATSGGGAVALYNTTLTLISTILANSNSGGRDIIFRLLKREGTPSTSASPRARHPQGDDDDHAPGGKTKPACHEPQRPHQAMPAHLVIDGECDQQSDRERWRLPQWDERQQHTRPGPGVGATRQQRRPDPDARAAGGEPGNRQGLESERVGLRSARQPIRADFWSANRHRSVRSTRGSATSAAANQRTYAFPVGNRHPERLARRLGGDDGIRPPTKIGRTLEKRRAAYEPPVFWQCLTLL